MAILPGELLTENDLLPDGVSKINKGITNAKEALQKSSEMITEDRLSRDSVTSEKIVENSITVEKVDFINKSENLFDPNDPDNKNGYLNNGVFVPSNSYYTSHKIFTNSSRTYTIRYAEQNFGAFYDKNGKFLSKLGTSSGVSAPFTFTAPDNAYYMKICGMINNKGTDMVVEGGMYPSSYIPFSLALSDKVMIVPKDNSLTTEKYKNKSVSIEKTNFIEQSINVFDKSSANNVKGGYLNTDGTTTSNPNLFYTHSIPVSAGEVYKISKSDFMSDGTNGVYYDKNGSRVSGVTGISTPDNLYRTITVPLNSNIASMKINYEISKIDFFMIAKGETYPSQYVPFKLKLSEKIGLNATQLSEIGIISQLSGKIIALNGDSIMAGAGFAGGFGKIIADRNGMIYENKAVGGGTITSGTTAKHWISRTINTMREDADYIILEGGVNDASLNVPFGTISSGYTATLDDTTFCGAFESMLKQAILRFQGRKIGFIIVHNVYNPGMPWHTQYYSAIKQMCEKWGIPYCDLQASVPPLNLIDELKRKYTLNGDGWHPNEDGYKQFYVDKIESWMKTL